LAKLTGGYHRFCATLTDRYAGQRPRRPPWVIERLQTDGYKVTAPQFPESSLADDVARLRQVLNRQDGPTVVVAHSYGGHIMTALGNNAPNVVGLVYIAGFGLDEGESIAQSWPRARLRQRSRTSISTTGAWGGSPRTTSSITSRQTSVRSRRR
jgi:pimeloyl-ACP methyl ester carboxylesterase